MATYVVPQVLVFQELQLVPQADIREQPAFICGGHAHLLRYDEADEKNDGFLGYYDDLSQECAGWPGRPAGGLVDPDYTRVYLDDALLRYFQDFIGAGSPISVVEDSGNLVRSDSIVFATNGEFAHSASLLDRGVKIGDAAKVRAVIGGDAYVLWTYVAGFVGEVVEAVLYPPEPSSDNAETQSAPAVAYSKIAGPENCVDIDSADSTAYDGLADGDINETYTITVIEGSVDGDATTAVLRVTSASGDDDVLTLVPESFGDETAIGTRGLTVTFDYNSDAACSTSAFNDGVSDEDFIPGQTWEVECGQAFAAPSALGSGDYVGPVNQTYIVEVIKGGKWADGPQIVVSSNKGVDASGPTTVSAPLTAQPVGTQGLTIQFTEAGLSKGDMYFIHVEAEKEGAYQTIRLGHNLHPDVQADGDPEVDLTLYIRKSLEVPTQSSTPGVLNWTQSPTELCLNEGLTAIDSTWTNNGVPVALPVFSEESKGFGKVFVQYRAWLSDLCAEVNQIRDVGEINAIPGPLHPDNPLKWGVFKALSNSNGASVSFASVCNPNSVDSWLNVVDLVDGREDVYGIVPLTRNKTVLDIFEAHVNSQSSAEMGRWRVLWTNLDAVEEIAIVSAETTTDGEVALAILVDDPNTSGTQYTRLEVPGGNANFVASGVRPGDVVRFLYAVDAFGEPTYSEFVVDAVVNEDVLRLQNGHSAAVTPARKVEVWRDLSATEQSAELAKTNGFNSRRVMAVWPDEVGSGGLVFPGYHLCAALAGLASGVAPHQGLTNLEISGFDDLSRTVEVFGRSQLNVMAGGGAWIVTQDQETGKVFSRHAVTTGSYDDINSREEMITRNLDSISFFFLDTYSPYIGVSNVTADTIQILRAETNAAIQTLRSRYFVSRLGAQLIDALIIRLEPHVTLKDRVVARINLRLPYPLNHIECQLVV